MARIANRVPPVAQRGRAPRPRECNVSRPTRRSADSDRCRARSAIWTPRSCHRSWVCTVTSVSVIGGDAGTSSRARLALTGDDVPESVFVKMAAETAATRLMGEVGSLAETETRFYRELSPELTGVPKSYGSAFDSVTGRFVLVLEDLAVDRLRVSRHASSAHQGPGKSDSRTSCPTARDVLGARARTGCTPPRPIKSQL